MFKKNLIKLEQEIEIIKNSKNIYIYLGIFISLILFILMIKFLVLEEYNNNHKKRKINKEKKYEKILKGYYLNKEDKLFESNQTEIISIYDEKKNMNQSDFLGSFIIDKNLINTYDNLDNNITVKQFYSDRKIKVKNSFSQLEDSSQFQI